MVDSSRSERARLTEAIMKILATFDGSTFSESIIPQLRILSALPGAELILLRVDDVPHGQTVGDAHPPTAATPASAGSAAMIVNATPPVVVETKEQAVERVNSELADYLAGIASQLPAAVPCAINTILDGDVKSAIVRFAMERQVDLIVMATHGRTGLVHVLVGDVAEGVVRAGVAPVLLVHPQAIAQSRGERR
jgi:nucleotide-binding universal stress UspA family protein